MTSILEAYDVQNETVITESIYHQMLDFPKMAKQTDLNYYRFKIFLILTRYTGLSPAVIANATKKDIQLLINARENTLIWRDRIVTISPEFFALFKIDLKRFHIGMELVFRTQQTLSGTTHMSNWDRFIINNLERFTRGQPYSLTKRSLRTAYLTTLFTELSPEEIWIMVNNSF